MMDIINDNADGEIGRIDIDENITAEPGENQELFDSYDNSDFTEEPASVPVKNRSSAVFYGGTAAVLAAAVTGYFFIAGNKSPSVSPSAVSAVSAVPATVGTTASSDVSVKEEVKFPEEGLLKKPEAIKSIGYNSDNSEQSIDYGQPPVPNPTRSEKFGNITPDEIASKIQNEDVRKTSDMSADESVKSSDNAPIATGSAAAAAENENISAGVEAQAVSSQEADNKLPLPGNIENIEAEAKEIRPDPASETGAMPVPGVSEKTDITTTVPVVEKSETANTNPAMPAETLQPAKDTETAAPAAVTVAEPGPVADTTATETATATTAEADKTQASDVTPSVSENTDNSAETEADNKASVTEEAEKPVVKAAAEEKIPETEPLKEASEKVKEKVYTVPVKHKTAEVKKPVVKERKWVLRSAQMGVAFIAEIGGSGELVRVSEGQNHPGIGRIKRIAPINGKWIIEGETGKIEQ